APAKKPAQSKPASTGGSIVDYLKSIGVDSSQANRKKLAKEYGVAGYDFSAEKNLELLNKMKAGKKPSATAKHTVKKGDQKTGSIVDYLKSINQDSSFANRKKLAAKHGIKNYTGTAAQNKQLLKKLRG